VNPNAAVAKSAGGVNGDETLEMYHTAVFPQVSRHFENVLFAESRNPQLSKQIVEYLK
jgi:hypothetical protein